MCDPSATLVDADGNVLCDPSTSHCESYLTGEKLKHFTSKGEFSKLCGIDIPWEDSRCAVLKERIKGYCSSASEAEEKARSCRSECWAVNGGVCSAAVCAPAGIPGSQPVTIPACIAGAGFCNYQANECSEECTQKFAQSAICKELLNEK
jgi:hypothetical protein